ncbi:MAG: bifunctional uridylyltransferase/uridylyl-removing protein, partial [Variovorax sp.]
MGEIIDVPALVRDLAASAGAEPGSVAPSKMRADVLALLKDRITAGRTAAEAMLFEDGSGLFCAARLSALQDEIIRAVYDFALERVFVASNLSSGERVAVVAVGGYGRGTLAPGSDIDLLFLLPYKQTVLGEQVLEFLLYLLWDLGFKVG